MATSNNKTVKPTGLTITRSGNTFTFKWKQGDKDYKKGQQLQYRLRNSDSAWTKVNIGVTATSASITNANVTFLQFRVAGKRQAYKKGKKTISPLWSAWAQSGSWTAAIPARPSVEYENVSVNRGVFKWNTSVDNTGRAVFDNAVVQTQLRRDNVVNPTNGAWTTLYPAGAASGATTITEEPEELINGTFIRWVRVKSHGNAGDSAWAYASHAYGAAATANLISAKAVIERPGVSRITAQWSVGQSNKQPIDAVTVQYVIAVPWGMNSANTSLLPPSSGWKDAIELKDAAGKDAFVVNVDDAVSTDECMWVRIRTEHDGLYSYSNAICAQIGKLAAPTINAVPNFSTGVVSITITEETSCTIAQTAIFYRPADNPQNDQLLGILERGTTTASYTVPDLIGKSASCFGAYALIGQKLMVSDNSVDTDIAAVAPARVTVSDNSRDETVRISWEWTWTDAVYAELSWADHEDAWESTDEPEMYRVEDRNAANWTIAGIETGKRWYFRVRLIGEQDGAELVGPWSGIAAYDKGTVPDKPVLLLSKTVINNGEAITARWSYAAAKGAEQTYAEIALVDVEMWGLMGDPEAELEPREVNVYKTIASTGADQSLDIDYEWETGKTYDLAVRITTTGGTQSVWSDPVALTVVEPVNIVIAASKIKAPDFYQLRFTRDWSEYVDGELDSVGSDRQDEIRHPTWLTPEIYDDIYKKDGYVSVTVETDGNRTKVTETTQKLLSIEPEDYQPALQAMPFNITITGAGTAGTTILSIVRAEDFHVYRPDEKYYDGFEGETVFTRSQIGEDPIIVNVEDLVGSLDFGARYKIIATVIDEYGQTASEELPFIVDWSHSPRMPLATVVIDPDTRIAKITPDIDLGEAGTVAEGDCCDIYRITADQPELIYKGAQYGTTYVDPYPAFGGQCGHRIVARSCNGDYITGDGRLAWYDTDADDGDILEEKKMVIDVDGDQIELPYNIELSNSWNKDFERTQYLGGSVQGDWNPAVMRDLTARTVLLRGRDLDKQLAVRDLAGYAGIAHIRTPDGSSMACDIQVTENMDYKSKRLSYSLTIRAVDPQEPEGMTLEEWEARQEQVQEEEEGDGLE